MKAKYSLNDWLRKIQDALAGVITVITSLVTLIVAMRGEPALYKLIIAIVILVVLFAACWHIAFSRTKLLIHNGIGPYRYERYRLAAIVGLGVIVGIIVAFISLHSNWAFVKSAITGVPNYSDDGYISEQICNQVVITPNVNRINLTGMPNLDGGYGYEDVTYEIQAPKDTGIEILFHKAQHLIIDGEQENEIVTGRHFTHANEYIPAGKARTIHDGVQLGKYDSEAAAKFNTVVFTHRLTFSMISDKGLYCEKAVEFDVEMSGLVP